MAGTGPRSLPNLCSARSSHLPLSVPSSPMGIGLEPREERGPGLLKRATSPRTTAGRTFSEDNVGDCGIHVVGAGLGNECPRSCGGTHLRVAVELPDRAGAAAVLGALHVRLLGRLFVFVGHR